MASVMDEEWEIVAGFLPEDWRELARKTGAMRRARGEIGSADTLLQILLMHVATGLSLKQTVVRAQLQELATITDVALLKRLRSSEPWLRELARAMFHSSRFAGVAMRAPEGLRLRAVDATTVEEPGATGTDWRVHYSVTLPDLQCDFYEITDDAGGEKLKRFPVHEGDLILGDRGYCHREGVAHVLRQKGHALIRLNSHHFPLETRGGKAFNILEHARSLYGHRPGEWPVQFEAYGKKWHARFCAVRKSKVAADIAKKKVISHAKKKGHATQPETLEGAEYIYLLVTVKRSVLSTREVLDLYRARWQIELCFKRMKSLLRLGHVPKRSDESARAWIQGKLLTVLLIERLLDEARLFSPWGFAITSSQSLA